MEEKKQPSKLNHRQLSGHMQLLPDSQLYAIQYKGKGAESGPWKYLYRKTNCGQYYVVRLESVSSLRKLLITFSIKENRLARIVRVSPYLMDDQTEPSAFEVVHTSDPRKKSSTSGRG